jgi:subtilase family serine protease
MHARRLLIASACLAAVAAVAVGSVFIRGAGAAPGASSAGAFAHPTYKVGRPFATSTYSGGYSPLQIKDAYSLSGISQTGSGVTIGIVDAYNDPTAQSDFDTFATQFGLQTSAQCGCFSKVNQNGGTSYPRTDSGWALEISLDIEWAHAIAPGAKILLVEAKSNSFANLLAAEDYATSHATVVSNSWGGSEFSGETGSSYDGHFNKNVAITVSAGDSGTPADYPSASPYVLSIGGTSLTINNTTGGKNSAPGGCNPSPCTYGGETVWSSGGGGASAYEPEPGYQNGYCGTTANVNNCGGMRGTPDVAWDADPNTGVAVYDSTAYQGQKGWWVIGGTSVGAPSVAGVVALADQAKGTLVTNNLTSRFAYQSDATSSNYGTDYHDITSGSNGSPCCIAGTGYDLASGLGSPVGSSWISNA